MRIRPWLRPAIAAATLVLVLQVSTVGSAQEGAAPAPEAPPDLPPDVTLAQIAAKQKAHCTFIGNKIVKQKVDAPTIAPLPELMPKVLALQPTSLDVAAAHPSASKCVKSLCDFLHKTNCPDGVVEAMIRANCKEKLYKNCEIIDAAACKCKAECVARWRTQYPDNN